MATRQQHHPNRLTRQVQCRFTDLQFDLVNRLAIEANRPISAVVRDVVTVWAMGHGLADLDTGLHNDLVREMVAELQALEDQA